MVDAQGAVVSTLRAGEYFGENALLERRKQRNSSLRCKSACDVLKLSADDFEAGRTLTLTLTLTLPEPYPNPYPKPNGFEAGLPEARATPIGSASGGGGGGGGTAAAEARLLAFIQMVSPG